MSFLRPRYLTPTRTLILLGVLACAGAVAILLSRPPAAPAIKPQLVAATGPVVASLPAAAPARPPSSPTPVAPAFDIVRVGPTGNAVMAGRSEPGADVTVLDSGKAVGVARADQNGNWMLVPAAPLPSGSAELTLSSQGKTGQAVLGEAPVLLVIPGSNAPAAPPLVVLAQPNAPSRLLQAPESTTPGKLGLDTVDYDDHGAIRFSGTAPPRAPVRVYVDTAPVGDAIGDASGHWTLSPTQAVEPGIHKLRLDQLAANGKVANRLELPFLRETLAQSQVAPGSVVVQPRQNLWRLARRAYGAGIRYTVIYQANQDQIRDPRLIYVGQVFSIPAVPPP
jgi:nucleoid-associated protein YgaU